MLLSVFLFAASGSDVLEKLLRELVHADPRFADEDEFRSARGAAPPPVLVSLGPKILSDRDFGKQGLKLEWTEKECVSGARDDRDPTEEDLLKSWDDMWRIMPPWKYWSPCSALIGNEFKFTAISEELSKKKKQSRVVAREWNRIMMGRNFATETLFEPSKATSWKKGIYDFLNVERLEDLKTGDIIWGQAFGPKKMSFFVRGDLTIVAERSGQRFTIENLYLGQDSYSYGLFGWNRAKYWWFGYPKKEGLHKSNGTPPRLFGPWTATMNEYGRNKGGNDVDATLTYTSTVTMPDGKENQLTADFDHFNYNVSPREWLKPDEVFLRFGERDN